LIGADQEFLPVLQERHTDCQKFRSLSDDT
jgi:hypothetical protein